MWHARLKILLIFQFWPPVCFHATGGPRWLILKNVRILPVHVRLRTGRSIAAVTATTPATWQILPAVAGIWIAPGEPCPSMPQWGPTHPHNGDENCPARRCTTRYLSARMSRFHFEIRKARPFDSGRCPSQISGGKKKHFDEPSALDPTVIDRIMVTVNVGQLPS